MKLMLRHGTADAPTLRRSQPSHQSKMEGKKKNKKTWETQREKRNSLDKSAEGGPNKLVEARDRRG